MSEIRIYNRRNCRPLRLLAMIPIATRAATEMMTLMEPEKMTKMTSLMEPKMMTRTTKKMTRRKM